jgi:ornithine cyclodeaminase
MRRNLARYGFRITRSATAMEAVEGAEIITTVTADKQYATILTDNMVGAGVHINAVGGDCPGQDRTASRRAAALLIFVEYPPQTRIEGDIQQLDADHPVDRALAGHRWCGAAGPARYRARSRCSTRSASRSRISRRCAMSMSASARAGNYDDLDLIADPDDSRDLFGMLMRAPE